MFDRKKDMMCVSAVTWTRLQENQESNRHIHQCWMGDREAMHKNREKTIQLCNPRTHGLEHHQKHSILTLADQSKSPKTRAGTLGANASMASVGFCEFVSVLSACVTTLYPEPDRMGV